MGWEIQDAAIDEFFYEKENFQLLVSNWGLDNASIVLKQFFGLKDKSYWDCFAKNAALLSGLKTFSHPLNNQIWTPRFF